MQTTGEMAEQAICFAAEQVRNRIVDFVSNLDRPSVIFKPRLSQDGDKWIALYGDNLQEGVVGIGESPGEAMYHFDIAWEKRIVIEAAETGSTNSRSPKIGKYRVNKDWRVQQAYGGFTAPTGTVVEVEQVTYTPDKALVRFGDSVEWIAVAALNSHCEYEK